MSIVTWKEDETARILVVDDEKDSVVVVRDDHIEQAPDRQMYWMQSTILILMNTTSKN
jgi:hypothetical protein